MATEAPSRYAVTTVSNSTEQPNVNAGSDTRAGRTAVVGRGYSDDETEGSDGGEDLCVIDEAGEGLLHLMYEFLKSHARRLCRCFGCGLGARDGETNQSRDEENPSSPTTSTYMKDVSRSTRMIKRTCRLRVAHGCRKIRSALVRIFRKFFIRYTALIWLAVFTIGIFMLQALAASQGIEWDVSTSALLVVYCFGSLLLCLAGRFVSLALFKYVFPRHKFVAALVTSLEANMLLLIWTIVNFAIWREGKPRATLKEESVAATIGAANATSTAAADDDKPTSPIQQIVSLLTKSHPIAPDAFTWINRYMQTCIVVATRSLALEVGMVYAMLGFAMALHPAVVALLRRYEWFAAINARRSTSSKGAAQAETVPAAGAAAGAAAGSRIVVGKSPTTAAVSDAAALRTPIGQSQLRRMRLRLERKMKPSDNWLAMEFVKQEPLSLYPRGQSVREWKILFYLSRVLL
eukprot:GHVU01219154.1.p1 GENE.GHVU01219154.1~~GHVU01219154.1.p1  ORF type:complete len:462 (+),score=60.01 GHVU01219154.1:1093-2478(+)